mmetsp:Transcript_11109/g.14622  ORF Transcript_11109/g.14622 Transcript_11109/m.14622 type:complete len:239 (-) Transcript_11109:680-1396(-)
MIAFPFFVSFFFIVVPNILYIHSKAVLCQKLKYKITFVVLHTQSHSQVAVVVLNLFSNSMDPALEGVIGLIVVKTVRMRSNSLLRAIMVVISLTVIRLTSSPSIAIMRSPGLIFSTNTEDVRTPLTTVPLASALLAKMIPNFPGGAKTLTLVFLTPCVMPEAVLRCVRWEARLLRDARDVRDVPLILLPDMDPDSMPRPPAPPAPPPLFSVDPTMANCISNLNKSFATLFDCSDICDK